MNDDMLEFATRWFERQEEQAKSQPKPPLVPKYNADSEDKTQYLTVGTLIDKLSQYPRDAVILIEDPDTQWDAPIFVKQDDDGAVLLWSEYGEMCSRRVYSPDKPPHYRKAP